MAPFDKQPTLGGELVHLRPLAREDFDALYAVANDPLLWEQHPANDRWRRDVFEGFFRDALDSGGALLARDAETRQVIGSSRYHGDNAEKREVEIGWTFLARSHWGGRYNGEMKRLMLTHAFQSVDRVLFHVGPTNLRSQRAVEKLGASLVGKRVDGEGRESLLYEITASRFAAS